MVIDMRPYSADITSTHVNQYSVKSMVEVRIDISVQKVKSFKGLVRQDFDVVISTCDETEKACPFLPTQKILHWGSTDPLEAKRQSKRF